MLDRSWPCIEVDGEAGGFWAFVANLAYGALWHRQTPGTLLAHVVHHQF